MLTDKKDIIFKIKLTKLKKFKHMINGKCILIKL